MFKAFAVFVVLLSFIGQLVDSHECSPCICRSMNETITTTKSLGSPPVKFVIGFTLGAILCVGIVGLVIYLLIYYNNRQAVNTPALLTKEDARRKVRL